MLDFETLRLARRLFRETDSSHYVLTNGLENLYATIMAGEHLKAHRPTEDLDRLKHVYNAIECSSPRLTDLLARLTLIDWFWAKWAHADSRDPFVWDFHAALLIKDFHVDATAVMDSLALVMLSVTKDINRSAVLPSFAMLSSERHPYRKVLASEFCVLVDGAQRWWPHINLIRNILVHRDHKRMVFGNPCDGKYFQVLNSSKEPMVVQPEFQITPLLEFDDAFKFTAFSEDSEKKVVDFEKYSAFVIAEILALSDVLGLAIGDWFRLELAYESRRGGPFAQLPNVLDALIAESETDIAEP
jgi:hypothetical protein